MTKTIEVSLSRAHKIAERLKDLMKDSLAAVEAAATPTRFTARPAPSVCAELALRAGLVLAQVQTAGEYADAWAKVRSTIARENHKRGIDVKLTELESLNKLVAAHKLLVAHSAAEGYLPSEMAEYQPEAGAYGYGLTANPLREPIVANSLAAALGNMQRRAIQLSDAIAEANAPRVVLELPEAILAEVTGVLPSRPH